MSPMSREHVYHFSRALVLTLIICTQHLSQQTLASEYYVNNNRYQSYACPDGPTGTCNIYCDYAYGAQRKTFDCQDAGQCNVYCSKKKCAETLNLYASNSHNLNIICESTGDNCMKNAKIYAPNNGNVTAEMGNSKQGLRGIKVYAGTNTQNILITIASSVVRGDDAKDMRIYAETAQYVHVTLSNGLEWEDGQLYCPVNSDYNGPDIAPCVLDASDGNGKINDCSFYAPDGIPKGIWIIPGIYQGWSKLTCTAVNGLNGGQSGEDWVENGDTFDQSSNCWWTRDPTSDPTTDPTYDPTSAPTQPPTSAPTLAPTQPPTSAPTLAPTNAPTSPPTIAPTFAPTSPPTLAPSVAPTLTPTLNPTNAPSLSPSTAPSHSPSLSPTAMPTNPTTEPTSDPTNDPTIDPTFDPTIDPTIDPTRDPTIDPTFDPTFEPTFDPTKDPTIDPTADPTRDPTFDPTLDPTLEPTTDPTIDPTLDPTTDPTYHPTQPTYEPTFIPTFHPTFDPTLDPTIDPTFVPTLDPTTDPTIDPTYDPTTDPTIDPTSDPTTDPTYDPTTDPTYDPTKDPTFDPTLDPSADPTFDPTKDPTIDPTTDPTVDPTTDPTSDPTSDPTFDPTNDPSIDPTIDPTTDPTTDPSNAPTLAPSLAPTLAPSLAPSFSPTAAPTVVGDLTQAELFMYYNMSEDLSSIILTVFNSKMSFAAALAIRYASFSNDKEQYKFMHSAYTCVAFTISSFDKNADDWDEQLFNCEDYEKEIKKSEKQRNSRYKPKTKQAQYLAVIRVVMTGDDADDSVSRVSQLTELLAYSHDENTNANADADTNVNKSTNSTYAAFIDVQERCMMGDTAESEQCTEFLGLNLEYFKVISMDAGFVTEFKIAPIPMTFAEKAVIGLKYIIYGLIGLCFCISILGRIHAKKMGADNVKPFGILFFSLYTWDFYSDVMFCVRLGAAAEWVLFGICMMFIFVPWIMNIVQLFQAEKYWISDETIQEGVRGWFMDWNIVLIMACVVSGNSFGSIEVTNSNLFGMELFSMGLPPHSLKEFQSKRLFSSVCLENIPQLVVQIYFLLLLGSFDEATFNALLSSSISVVLSVVDIWSAKRLLNVMDKAKKDDHININNIEFIIDQNNEIEMKKRILVNKPRHLAKAIAETVEVDVRNVEVYQLMVGDHGLKVGFTVYTLDHTCEKMITDIINKRLALQYLISNYWKLKSFVRLRNFQRGQLTHLEILENIAKKEKAKQKAQRSRTTHAKTVSKIQLIRLSQMRKSQINKVRAMDPQLHKLQTSSIGQESEDESDLDILPTIEHKEQWSEYMQQLKTYAETQSEIYAAHPVGKDQNILSKLDTNTDENVSLLWSQYTQSMNQLLSQRYELLIVEETPIPLGTDEETVTESELDLEHNILMQKMSDMDGLVMETNENQNLHQTIQEEIRSHLSMFDLAQNGNDKKEVTINSSPMGITWDADMNGYNTKVLECDFDDSIGVKQGMILAYINEKNVLGLHSEIVTNMLNNVQYPIKLTFVSDTNSIRFDWVLSAASFIKFTLNHEYSRDIILEFLVQQKLSQLEIISAMHLNDERSELLPHVHLVSDEVSTNGEINPHILYSLFMQSHNINQDTLIEQEQSDYNSDSNLEAAMDDMVNSFGLAPLTPSKSQSKSKTKSVRSPGANLLFHKDSKTASDRIPILKVNVKTNSKSNSKKITPKTTPIANIANAVAGLFSKTDEQKAADILTAQDMDQSLYLALGSQTNSYPTNDMPSAKSQIVFRKSNSSVRPVFITQLQLVKMNSNDSKTNKIPKDCYTQQQFIAALKEENMEFSENEMEEIMQYILDINSTLEYGMNLISENSLAQFIDTDVDTNETLQRLLNFMIEKNSIKMKDTKSKSSNKRPKRPKSLNRLLSNEDNSLSEPMMEQKTSVKRRRPQRVRKANKPMMEEKESISTQSQRKMRRPKRGRPKHRQKTLTKPKNITKIVIENIDEPSKEENNTLSACSVVINANAISPKKRKNNTSPQSPSVSVGQQIKNRITSIFSPSSPKTPKSEFWSAAESPKKKKNRPKNAIKISVETPSDSGNVFEASQVFSAAEAAPNPMSQLKIRNSHFKSVSVGQQFKNRISSLFVAEKQPKEMKSLAELTYTEMSTVHARSNSAAANQSMDNIKLPTYAKKLKLTAMETNTSTTEDVRRESEFEVKVNEMEKHKFLSELSKCRMKDRKAKNIPNHCYSQAHFVRAMNQNGIELELNEIEEIMQEILDIQATIENGTALISEQSFNEFIACGGKSRSKPAKQFWTLMMDKYENALEINEEDVQIVYDQ